MAKVKSVVKLQLDAGKATAGPPVGSSLGPHCINIGIDNTSGNISHELLIGDYIVSRPAMSI